MDSGNTTVKLSHDDIGLASFISGSSVLLTKKRKAKIVKKLAKKVGSKFVPVLGIASWLAFGYGSVMSKAGYSHTKANIKFERWSVYKHQGGRWARGSQYKNVVIKLSLIKK